MLAGYPYPGRNDKNVFNRRAALQLAPLARVRVASVRTWRPGRPLREDCDDGPVRVSHLSVPQYPRAPGWAEAWNLRVVAAWVKRLMRRELREADVLHSVGGSYSGLVGGWIARGEGVAHVAQLIGTDVNSDLPRLWGAAAVRSFPERVDCVGCNSRALRSAYEQLFPTADAATVIYRGVPLDLFTDPSPPREGPASFLYLGGLPDYGRLPSRSNTKGGFTLMEAWRRFERELVESGATLSFGGPDATGPELLRWRDDLVYPGSVELLGLRTPDEVRADLRAATVVVVPSLEEGLPNVAMEAGASARPVIGTTVGGLPEVVEHDRTGWLVPAGDAESLGSAMVGAARSPRRVAEMGVEARRHIETRFDAKTFASQYVALYQRAIEGR